jgi:hypothetical protein
MNEYQNNYLSELEQEFDFNNEDTVNETADEFELDGEAGTYEMADESGLDSEGEFDQEESENWLNEYGGADNEFEEKLYAALSGDHESNYEMEQAIDQVLHEMEQEYFWGAAKKFWKKHKGKLMGIAGKYLPKGTLQALGSLAGGDVRGLLKSDLFKKGLSLAANAVAPGVGGMVAGGLLNNEVNADTSARSQAAKAVQMAKTAYQDMARRIPGLQPGNIQAQIKNMGLQSLAAAKSRHQSFRKGRKRTVVPIAPNAVVVVHPGRIIIYS